MSAFVKISDLVLETGKDGGGELPRGSEELGSSAGPWKPPLVGEAWLSLQED